MAKAKQVDGGSVAIAPMEVWEVSKLEGASYNPRRMSEGAMGGLRASLREFGLVQDVVVNRRSGRVVGGHQRLRVLVEGGAVRVPVKVVDLDEARERALNVALNNPEAQGEFTEGLGELLAGLERELPELAEELRFGELAEEEGLEVEDGDGGDSEEGGEAIVPLTEPETREGDVWVMGDHRLLCGDSFDAGARSRLLEGREVDAVVTDPPYAIYGSSTGIGADIADDKMVRPFFEGLGRALASSVKEFGHAYVFCDWRSWSAVWEGMKRGGLSPKNCIVWDKGGGLGNNYAMCHEFIGYFARQPPPTGMRSGAPSGQRPVLRPNIARHSRPSGDAREHNAAKPVALLRELVENSTDAGERVLDLFAGSGSVLAACEGAGRVCLSMEVEPRWCDVVVARWRRLTGREARRV